MSEIYDYIIIVTASGAKLQDPGSTSPGAWWWQEEMNRYAEKAGGQSQFYNHCTGGVCNGEDKQQITKNKIQINYKSQLSMIKT
ncbi:MAG: hypothetical protein ISS17_00455 [Bacteroidales bacterium]|nr:hypothetical protein [Bacteroidales bacterium]